MKKMPFFRAIRTIFLDPVLQFCYFQNLEPDTWVPVHTLVLEQPIPIGIPECCNWCLLSSLEDYL